VTDAAPDPSLFSALKDFSFADLLAARTTRPGTGSPTSTFDRFMVISPK